MPPESMESYGAKNKGKKGKGCLIVLVIFLLIFVAIIIAFALDVGGIRTDIIGGWLRNAPLVGSFFDRDEEVDATYEMTEEELRLAVVVYRNQIAALESERAAQNAQITAANARIAHLSRFEARWQEYRETSALFSQMLAHNEPVEFVTFFEAIVDHDLVPQDILAAAFAQAQAINVYDEELQVLVRTYNAMEDSRAAEDLERLLMANTTLAVRLVRAMSNTRRAEIFDEMEYTTSSTFAILLATEPPTFSPLSPPPYLPEIIEPVASPVMPGAVVPDDELVDESEEIDEISDELEEMDAFTDELLGELEESDAPSEE
ncbi:MAG: hypothetical protein FWF77_10055 [Defluviitaleaceae bacterium]|nr:hypothetical protein [Defluviitaleaceae bacterium]